ncbi:SulP family inorganic anion transporter [Schumannella luteola]|nr:SulP family inorganic anion transporter [Schumannella luteola]
MFPTLVGYRRAWLPSDVVAGISAGAVVVPQAMAYATIASLPVQVGLYTAIVPMLVYAALGGSRAMSVSTTSTIATLTASTLVTAGVVAGSDDALGSVMMLALLVGGLLLLARLLRLGGLVENISAATTLGVKIGVGGTVALGQVPKLLGETEDASGEGFIRSLLAIGRAVGSIDVPTLLLSTASIVVLVVLQRFAPRVPGALVVVVGGILLVGLVRIDTLGVELIAPVPSGLPVPGLPDPSHTIALVPGALAIAVMAFLESAAVARTLRRPDEPAVDADRELLATGAASVVGSFFVVLPAAGGFSQSAVNRGAGARTQLSGIVTVVLAVLVAAFLGPVLSLLPQASLAALVFVAVVSLIDVPTLISWARVSPSDFWIALAVAVFGLTAGLLPAVALGVVVTLVLVLRELNTPHLSTARRGSAVVVLPDQGLYTANVLGYGRAVLAVAAGEPEVTRVVLDLSRQPVMTVTVLEALRELERDLAATGVELHLAALPERAAQVAARVDWYRRLAAAGRVHASPDEAVPPVG